MKGCLTDKGCWSLLVCILVLAVAPTILASPESYPAFLAWISKGLIYVVVAPIVLLGLLTVLVLARESGAEDLLEWITQRFTGKDE